MKKIISLALALVMSMALSVPALAANEPPVDSTTGESRTIILYSCSMKDHSQSSWTSEPFTATPANGNYIRFGFSNTGSGAVRVYFLQDGSTDPLKTITVPANSGNYDTYYAPNAGSGTYKIKIEAYGDGGHISGSVNVSQYPATTGEGLILPRVALYTDTDVSSSTSTWRSFDFTATPSNGSYIRFGFSNTGSYTVRVYFLRSGSIDPLKMITIPANSGSSDTYYASNAGFGTYQIYIMAEGGGSISGSLNVVQYAYNPDPDAESEAFNPMRDNPRSECWDGANPFTDVETGPDYFTHDAWAYDVLYAWKTGLVSGTSATTFSPDDTCTRAMAWAVLARAAGVEISGTDWVGQAQAWAVENGVSDGTYPERAITVQELATMVYRQMGCPTCFSERLSWQGLDLPGVADWAREAVYWAVLGDIGPVSTSCGWRRAALGLDMNCGGAATRSELACAAASLHKMSWIRQDYLPYAYGSVQTYNMLMLGMY